MLCSLKPGDIGSGINLVDIGASGRLDRKWQPLEPLINLVAFEPNAEECERLSNRRTRLNSASYLPYAVGGRNAEEELYLTKSMYCSSLLQPNSSWLQRFSFAHLFEVTGTQTVPTRILAEVDELRKLDVDAVKVDTQGLELPILSSAGKVLDDAFYVETETGFAEQYVGETTYAEIDPYMRSQGYLLFDMNIQHRIPRNNHFKLSPTGNEQILWCEAVWLKDYVGLDRQGKLGELSREKAFKALLICALQGCIDFGFELATLFHAKGLLSDTERTALSQRMAWRLSGRRLRFQPLAAVAWASRLFPKRTRRKFLKQLERSVDQPDVVKTVTGRFRCKRAA